MKTFFAYDATITGGVTVARGDIDDDGVPDIVTGAGPDSPPLVRVFSGACSALDASGRLCPIELASFYAYDARFRGGVTVAVAEVTGDGLGDIITGAGPGASPHVQAFVLNAARQPRTVLSFYAYDPAFMGGVFVAAGDVDGDGGAEIITAPVQGTRRSCVCSIATTTARSAR